MCTKLLLKKFLFLILLLTTISSCAQHKKIVSKKRPKQKKETQKNAVKSEVKAKKENDTKDSDTIILTNKADSIVAFAKKYLGIKYRYGGQDLNGFDCAGFVCYVYSHHGITLPRTADAQSLLGKEVTRKSARAGDLVYFKGRNIRSKTIGHVGIVIENNNGQIKFISATVSSGIHIDDIDGPYWKERYVMVKRILLKK